MKDAGKYDIELYKVMKKFLLSFPPVSKNILEKYLKPEISDTEIASMNSMFERILVSAQNTQMSPNVIGKLLSGKKGDISPLGDLLFNFDPYKTMARYKSYSDEKLYEEISRILIKPPKGTKLWLRFCGTIKTASIFLSKFESIKVLLEYFYEIYNNPLSKNLLPYLISFEIHGFGMALACDFLKEVGFVNYGKPDTHVKDILIGIDFLKTKKNSIDADYQTLKILDRIGYSNGKTAYEIDKLLFLIGSGNFYLDKSNDLLNEIGRQKDSFIQYFKTNVVD